METASYLLAALGAILAVVATVLGVNSHRFSVLWIGYIAVICFVTSATCWLHNLWSNESPANPPTVTNIGATMLSDTPAETALHPYEILDAIEKTPPLQILQISKQYVGTRVSFDCELQDGSDSRIFVVLLAPNGGDEKSRFANIPIDLPKHNFLLHAERGTKLHVDGTIAAIDAPVVRIKDATIVRKDHD
jgi:hypothetical protein